MLRVFAPQLPLYGVGIVLTGVLQAHRRFAWPVLAPLLSSVTVIVATWPSPWWPGTNPDLSTVESGELPILPWAPRSRPWCSPLPAHSGEPAGSGLARARLEPSSGGRMQPGTGRRGHGRWPAGLPPGRHHTGRRKRRGQRHLQLRDDALPAAVGGSRGTRGHGRLPGDRDAFATADTQPLRPPSPGPDGRSCCSAVGAAGLAAVAAAADLPGHDPASALALAVLAFAPGLLGYGLAALHQRTLYAVGAQKLAAVMMGIGWTVTIAASVALSALLPLESRAAALGLANSVGMTSLGIALAIAVRKRCGPPAFKGMSRVTAAGAAASVAGGAAALALLWSIRPDTPGILTLIGLGFMSAAMAILVFAVVAALADRTEALATWAKLERLLRRSRRSAPS